MDQVLKKLRYRQEDRIAVLNAPAAIMNKIARALPGVCIDTEINPKYLYEFMLAFTPGSDDVNRLGPACIHNLSDDGKLWMAYCKGKPGKIATDINRDHGWDLFKDAGFRAVSQVAVDETWSALRFRNLKYVRSVK